MSFLLARDRRTTVSQVVMDCRAHLSMRNDAPVEIRNRLCTLFVLSLAIALMEMDELVVSRIQSGGSGMPESTDVAGVGVFARPGPIADSPRSKR